MKFRRSLIRVALLLANILVLALSIVLFPHSHQETSPTIAAADLTPVPNLPAGAAACDLIYDDVKAPFNAAARGTPMTTCGFAEQVRRAYSEYTQSPTGTHQLRVVSPATQKWYKVVCIASGDYATCAGGLGALIYLYNKD